jgi:hemolysin III
MTCIDERPEVEPYLAEKLRDDPHEVVNTLTHGAGALLAVVGSAVMLLTAWAGGNWWHLAGCGVYAASLIGVYLASTLSHAVFDPQRRHRFRRLDQGLIFLLIAGTYTPFAFAYLQTLAGWILTTSMWLVAWYGFYQKVLHRGYIDRTAVYIYLALGWMPLLGFPFIRHLIPLEVFLWILAGGVLYSLGTIFLMVDSRRYFFHAVWHVLVIAASAVHFWAVYKYVAMTA